MMFFTFSEHVYVVTAVVQFSSTPQEFGVSKFVYKLFCENCDFGAFLGLRGVSPRTESKTLAFQVRVEAIAVSPLACMEKVNIHEK